jgi:hypothetical protein
MATRRKWLQAMAFGSMGFSFEGESSPQGGEKGMVSLGVKSAKLSKQGDFVGAPIRRGAFAVAKGKG